MLHFLGVDLPTPPAADYALAMLITVGVTTVVWLTVTLLTPPEPDAGARRVLPPGPAGRAGLAPGEPAGWGTQDDQIPGGVLSWVNWVAGVAAVYASVFGLGAFLTGRPARRGGLRGSSAIGGFLVDLPQLAC